MSAGCLARYCCRLANGMAAFPFSVCASLVSPIPHVPPSAHDRRPWPGPSMAGCCSAKGGRKEGHGATAGKEVPCCCDWNCWDGLVCSTERHGAHGMGYGLLRFFFHTVRGVRTLILSIEILNAPSPSPFHLPLSIGLNLGARMQKTAPQTSYKTNPVTGNSRLATELAVFTSESPR